MPTARVENVDALRALKTALFKFADAANIAMADADSETHRTHGWLETEAPTYWQGQIRKRMEAVNRAREAVRQKTMFKDALGRQQSAVEEQKALSLALRNLQAAEEKLNGVRRWSRRLQKEIELYRGSMQPLANAIAIDLPKAAGQIDKIIVSLNAYLELVAKGATESSSPTEAGSMGVAGERVPSPPQEDKPPAADS
jgi:hypothetical protein